MNELKYLGITALIILAVLLLFTKSLIVAVRLSCAVIMLWLIPGYSLIHFFSKGFDELEKIILGFFIGFGLTALMLYYLNIFGLKSISPIFSYCFGFLALFILLFTKFFKAKSIRV